MIRRSLFRLLFGGTLGTIPGLGGQQEPPVNAARGQGGPVGIQAGVTGQLVARRVIIIGTGGELLVYSPSAGAGNLIASVAGQITTDAYGNTIEPGVGSYSGSNIALLFGGSLLLQSAPGQIAGGYAASVGQEVSAGKMALSSGGTSGLDVQAQIFLESAGAAGVSTQIQTAQAVQLTVGASSTIPVSSAGITTVSQVVSALISAGIFS